MHGHSSDHGTCDTFVNCATFCDQATLAYQKSTLWARDSKALGIKLSKASASRVILVYAE